ncbi:hypothetical protein P9112_010808 [Eukaryota sp. TZLM1-RC]
MASLLRSSTQVLSIDTGAYSIKVVNQGVSTLFPNLALGATEFRSVPSDFKSLSIDCADDTVHIPVQRGYITNFELQEAIWRKHLGPDGLDVDPITTRIVYSQPLFNFEFCRKNLVHTFFRQFESHAVSFPTSPFLSMFYASSHFEKTFGTSIVIDMGHSATWISVFINGILQWEKCRRLDIGGELLDRLLQYRLSIKYGVELNVLSSRTIKEQMCRVSDNFVTEIDEIEQVHCGIYNNTEVALDTEIIYIPECFFKPYLANVEQIGLVETVLHAINSLESPEFVVGTILLVGGSSKFKNFPQRLEAELKSNLPEKLSAQLVVNHPPEPEFAAARGGSLWSTQQDSLDVSLSYGEVMSSRWNSYQWKTNLR